MILTKKQIRESFKKIFNNKPSMYNYYILDNFNYTTNHINKYFTSEIKFQILKYETEDNN